MRLLDRYQIRELALPFIYCLSGFLVFWSTADLISSMDEFKEQGLHVLDILLYYFHLLPEILRNLLPVVLLLALLYSLTTHARYNEITAMRAAGIGVWRLGMPYFGAALVATVALAFIQEWWLPRSMPEAEKIIEGWYQQTDGKNPERWKGPVNLNNTLERRKWTIDEYDLLESRMYGVDIEETLESGRIRRLLGQEAWWTNRTWMMAGVNEHLFANPGERQGGQRRQHSILELHVTETPEFISSQIKLVDLESARVGKVVSTQFSIAEIMECQRLNPGLDEYLANLLDTKLHAQIASPFTCFVVVLIALPFAMRTGRRDMFLGVTSSIFMCFGYFILQRMALPLGISGAIPGFVAAWTPNVVFGVAGAWMLRKAN